MGSFMIFPLLSRKCEYSKPNNKNISFQTSLKTNSLYFQKKKKPIRCVHNGNQDQDRGGP